MIDMLAVDNAVLKNIIFDSRFDDLLSCLPLARERLTTALSTATGGCKPCGRNATVRQVLIEVRDCIVRLPPEAREEFKRRLNTRQVKFLVGAADSPQAVQF